jgi:hypothetical protein
LLATGFLKPLPSQDNEHEQIVAAAEHAIGYAEHRSRSHDAVIRVYDGAGNVIETHEHAGDFREPLLVSIRILVR